MTEVGSRSAYDRCQDVQIITSDRAMSVQEKNASGAERLFFTSFFFYVIYVSELLMSR